jgi:hypothetical protein
VLAGPFGPANAYGSANTVCHTPFDLVKLKWT